MAHTPDVRPVGNLPHGIGKTGARELAHHGVTSLALVTAHSQEELLAIHGVGTGFMWTRQTELQAAAASQCFAADRAVVAQQMIGSVPLRRHGRMEEIPGAVAFLLRRRRQLHHRHRRADRGRDPVGGRPRDGVSSGT